METDEDVIAWVEKKLTSKPLERLIHETLEKHLQQFVGQSMTSKMKAALQQQATQGIREVLIRDNPNYQNFNDPFTVEVVEDGARELTLKIRLEF
jgi:molybdopterin-guanine dinucleotide biosynthesis protein A